MALQGQMKLRFQSTLPSQGATSIVDQWNNIVTISIHAPLTGSDETGSDETASISKFQSTLPSQGATAGQTKITEHRADFNPRSPHRERQQIYT